MIGTVIAFIVGTAIGYIFRSFIRSGEVSWAYYEGVMDGIELESWASRKEEVE